MFTLREPGPHLVDLDAADPLRSAAFSRGGEPVRRYSWACVLDLAACIVVAFYVLSR